MGESYTLIDHQEHPIRSSGKRGVREQRLLISLRVTITLGSIGPICDFSDSLDILWGEPDLPSFHILFEIL
jgi:hypothetical protein